MVIYNWRYIYILADVGGSGGDCGGGDSDSGGGFAGLVLGMRYLESLLDGSRERGFIK